MPPKRTKTEEIAPKAYDSQKKSLISAIFVIKLHTKIPKIQF